MPVDVNLTKVITCFGGFNQNQDMTINPFTRAKEAFKNLNTFIDDVKKVLAEESNSDLNQAILALNDIKELIIEALCVRTNGAINLDDQKRDVSATKTKLNYSHHLGKLYIESPEKTAELFNMFSRGFEDLLKIQQQLKARTLDENQKLDDVDLLLLQSSQVSRSFQDTRFGGAVEINSKTNRSNTSLFFASGLATVKTAQSADKIAQITRFNDTIAELRARVESNGFGIEVTANQTQATAASVPTPR